MKKVILLALIFISSAMYAQTLLVNENFDYGSTANADILGVTTNWARHSGSQGPTYNYPGLSFTGYPSSGIGGALGATSGGSGVTDGDVNRLFTDVNTTSDIYISFLINMTSAKSTSDYFFHISQNPFMGGSTSVFRSKTWAISNGTGWNIGISKTSSTATTNAAVILEYNKTYLVVIKYAYNTTTTSDDAVSLWVYDTMPTSISSTALVSLLNVNDGSGDPADVGSVAVRQGSNTPTSTIDGIRVSTNWGVTVLGTATGITKDNNTIPTTFSLDQNYPNPFNPSTNISFSITEAGNYNLKVYDVLGKEVATLVNEQLSTGKYKVNFDARNLASGTYIYRLTGNNVNLSQKMLLVK